MKRIFLDQSIVILPLLVGLFFLSVAGTARTPSMSARPPTVESWAPAARHQAEAAAAENQAAAEAAARIPKEARVQNPL